MEISGSLKNNRTLKGAFPRPALQIRTFFVGAALGQLILSTVFMIFVFFTDNVAVSLYEGTGGAELLHDFHSSLFYIKLLIVSMTVLSLVGSLLAFTDFTKRVLGPTIPIIRFIEILKAGEYGNQKSLRQKDELKDVMSALNELSTELAKRKKNLEI